MTPSTVELKKVILERGRFVVLDIPVLHEKNDQPEIYAFGKVAGIESLQVAQAETTNGPNNYFQLIFAGGFVVNVIRFVICVVALALILYLVIKIENLKDNRRRRQRKERDQFTESQIEEYLSDLKPLAEKLGEKGNETLRFFFGLLVTEKQMLRDIVAFVLSPQNIRVLSEFHAQQEYLQKFKFIHITYWTRVLDHLLLWDSQERKFRVRGEALKLVGILEEYLECHPMPSHIQNKFEPWSENMIEQIVTKQANALE